MISEYIERLTVVFFNDIITDRKHGVCHALMSIEEELNNKTLYEFWYRFVNSGMIDEQIKDILITCLTDVIVFYYRQYVEGIYYHIKNTIQPVNK